MKTETQFIQMSDGARLALHSWLPENPPRAVLLICHGMVEYARRYDYAAARFADEGFAVFAHDQRGHGETAGSLENAGFIAEHDGFSRAVLDAREIAARLKNDFAGKKIALLGHSFGSFVAQGFIEQYGAEIDACILSGTAGPRRALMAAALVLSVAVGAFKGKKYRSMFLRALTFGSYNARIPNAKSFFDWLSRDEEIVRLHDADPWCTFISTAAFTRDLVGGLLRIHAPRAMKAIPRPLPVLLFSGDADPVGGYGKTVSALARIYKANGMTDVTLTLYAQGRHEMLNEINKDQVISDILLWLCQRGF
jgi:alpha-beta hydrolase superfamily lysophospholipase